MKDWPNETKRWGNEKVEVRGSDEAFRNMVERMLDKGTPPRTSLYAYLEDDEDNQEEMKEEGEEEDSNQED